MWFEGGYHSLGSLFICLFVYLFIYLTYVQPLTSHLEISSLIYPERAQR